jgi:hypothetical protein
METQTRIEPLNVVRVPLFDAAVAGENLEFFGGRTLPRLEWSHVYLGNWSADDRKSLDSAVPAALGDARLNHVIEQYFPGQRVESVFAGAQNGPMPSALMDKAAVEQIVGTLALESLAALLLPRGVVLSDGDVTSEHGLGGYHGSVDGHYYAVSVYSEGTNGIVAFDKPWKNVCATFYHELNEARTDPDVEDAIRAGSAPNADSFLGWYSPKGGEIGDIPMEEAGANLASVMKEVPLVGGGTAPIQLMWSNAIGAPEGPIAKPHPPSNG